MEIVTVATTVAEFFEYGMDFIYTGFSELFVQLADVPEWLSSCFAVSFAVALICRVWR